MMTILKYVFVVHGLQLSPLTCDYHQTCVLLRLSAKENNFFYIYKTINTEITTIWYFTGSSTNKYDFGNHRWVN